MPKWTSGIDLRVTSHPDHPKYIFLSHPTFNKRVRLTPETAFEIAVTLLHNIRRCHHESPLGILQMPRGRTMTLEELTELANRPVYQAFVLHARAPTTRTANCLHNANINYLGELIQKTEREMLKTKSFGRKSLEEINELLADMNLSLGMKLDGWIPPSTVQEKIP